MLCAQLPMATTGSGESRASLRFGEGGFDGSFSDVQLHFLILAHPLVLFADCCEFFRREPIQAQYGVLCLLGGAQQLVNLDVQHIVVPVLGVLDQENHQKRDDGGGSVDDQLPGIVVVKPRARGCP